MRKLLLLPLLLLLAGCQTIETADPAVAAQLQGSWINTAVVQEYYDASDKLVYERSPQPDSLVYRFTDKTLAIILDSTLFTNDSTSSIKTLETASFKLSEIEGTPRITFTLGSSGYSNTVIKSISGSAMEWENVYQNQAYQDSTDTKTAAKMVVRHSFTKRQ
ncbi:hypothetical protein I2I11_01590 [Pontibacter sp. 172403-2]|uniref:hypothetical protein n=1 Tax=Pontibacter rufus TaxID=2791028 RepID=UPI0018AFAE9D|nr:hypothetical protein [Pontibacter sp. 172403-2]MBF9251976.1 hypothetical protein [Pontibacter sp. 172403-2]